MTRPKRLRPHVLLTDEPGVVVHNPHRKLAQILVLYALLPLICASIGAYIAYELANFRTDQRVDALEGDLKQRRAARAAEDRVRDERLAQTRRDLCTLLDRLTPRDAPVEDLRRRYGCTGPGVAPSPSPRPTVGGVRSDAGSGSGDTAPTGGPATVPRPVVTTTRPRPGPPGPTGPTGPPVPSGSPTPPDGGLVCLPILGCVL